MLKHPYYLRNTEEKSVSDIRRRAHKPF